MLKTTPSPALPPWMLKTTPSPTPTMDAQDFIVSENNSNVVEPEAKYCCILKS
jgi:hypothetical protein